VRVALEPKLTSVGGLTVRRALPRIRCRNVGPFVFLDHMGPTVLAPGQRADVLPHPHIGLATLSFLFDGALRHRDSLGSDQIIAPGDVNWMVAGRGIVHSERTPMSTLQAGQTVHGLQLWVALPDAEENCEPRFEHYAARALPSLERPGVQVNLLVGEGFGLRSPVTVLSPTLYAQAMLEQDRQLTLPDTPELAIYLIDGTLIVGSETFTAPQLVVFESRVTQASVTAHTRCHFVVLGGSPVGPRLMDWNFVASSQERIEQAKRNWNDRRFPTIPGDDDEFVPLPGA